MGFDFFLLTAVDIERTAVLERLSDVRSEDAPFFAGTITSDRGTTHNVLVAQSSESGTTRAAALTSKAIGSFRPQHVLLVGIAAGLRKNGVSLGDILVPGWIDPYEKVKKTRVAGQPRIEHREWMFPVTAGPLVSIARHINQAQEPWYNGIREPRPDNDTGVPALHVQENGVLGSGDKLIADEKAQERKYLLETHSKNALGFEMEAAGAGLVCRHEGVPFAVVKAVQDYGTARKNDLWRKYAAEAASHFVVRMMRRWEPVRLQRSSTVREEDICQKAQAEFSLKKMRGQTPSARLVDRLARNLVESWRGHGPRTIMVWSQNARIRGYLIPLLQKRIDIEVELRQQYGVPFTKKQVRALRNELINLSEEEWQEIVWDAFTDTLRDSEYLDYKLRELEADRQYYLQLKVKDGGQLLTYIDQSLRNAVATVSLAVE